MLQKLKKRILVHHQRLILLHVCSSVKCAIYVRNLFKVTLYFHKVSHGGKWNFNSKRFWCPVCQATSSLQILLISTHTHITESEKKWFIECAFFITHESVMLVKTSTFEHWKRQTNISQLILSIRSYMYKHAVICK